jgi:hypothetical protein
MNRLACTVCLLLLSTACGTLEVRVVNSGEQDLDSVVIHGIVDDEIIDVDYGSVPAGGDTDYIEWDQLREQSPTTVIIAGETFEFMPFDGLGTSVLTSGRHRHVVSVSGNPPQLNVVTRPD